MNDVDLRQEIIKKVQEIDNLVSMVSREESRRAINFATDGVKNPLFWRDLGTVALSGKKIPTAVTKEERAGPLFEGL